MPCVGGFETGPDGLFIKDGLGGFVECQEAGDAPTVSSTANVPGYGAVTQLNNGNFLLNGAPIPPSHPAIAGFKAQPAAGRTPTVTPEGVSIFYDAEREQFYVWEGARDTFDEFGFATPRRKRFLSDRDPLLQSPAPTGTGRAPAITSAVDANGDLVFFQNGTEVNRIPGFGQAEPPFFVRQGLEDQRIAQGQAFTAGQSDAARVFQANENALARAQSAEQFAQQIALQRQQTELARDQFLFQVLEAQANRRAQALRDRVDAATRLANVISMADPLAQEVFGRNIQGALAGGATGLTENAVEPAAQIQQTLTGNPIEQVRANILALREGTQVPSLFGDAASPDDLGLQNTQLANTSSLTLDGFLASLQARSGVARETAIEEAQRLGQRGTNRRSLALTAG